MPLSDGTLASSQKIDRGGRRQVLPDRRTKPYGIPDNSGNAPKLDQSDSPTEILTQLPKEIPFAKNEPHFHQSDVTAAPIHK